MIKKIKPVIGVLGGPGAGKSTLSEVLAGLGCAVINADNLNHRVLSVPEVRAKVVDCFGIEIVGKDGEIDRKVLSQKVFGNEGEGSLRKLTEIVHPEIFKLMEKQMSVYCLDEAVRAVVLDVPLLMEVGWESVCDVLIYIDVKDDIRRERLKQKRNWDEKLIKSVEKSQILLDKKREISDYIVENNSDIDNLRTQIEKISPEIM